jgi:hypothetical protein
MGSQKVCTNTTQILQEYYKIKARNETKLKIYAVYITVVINILMSISELISNFNLYKFLFT